VNRFLAQKLVSNFCTLTLFLNPQVDSRPRLEGKDLLRRLLRKGLKCTYTHVNGLCYIMQEVNRVFLGAATVLANGVVVSRAGSAATAMVSSSYFFGF
jgi:translation initiation factor eIF-2B subunit delta